MTQRRRFKLWKSGGYNFQNVAKHVEVILLLRLALAVFDFLLYFKLLLV